jgi:hypothetical protein
VPQRVAEPTDLNNLDFEKMFDFPDYDANVSWEICDLFATGNKDSIDWVAIFHGAENF